MSTELPAIKPKHAPEISVLQFGLDATALPNVGLQLTQLSNTGEWGYIRISTADVPEIRRRLLEWTDSLAESTQEKRTLRKIEIIDERGTSISMALFLTDYMVPQYVKELVDHWEGN